MRVAIYGRVSTKEQDVMLQLHDLRDYAHRRGWIVTEEYVDLGESGATCSRPALDRLMADARQRRFDVVLVWRFDRFARSTRHLLLALEEFRQLGVEFVSFMEHIDTGTPLGAAMFTIIGALAQFERELLIERVRAGIRKARAEGKRLGRPRVILNRGKIAELQRAGLSYHEIGRRLGLPKSTVFKYRDRSLNRAQKAMDVTSDGTSATEA
jgi:DNA invertase Pin-like site-specific DNA recombinase